MCFYSYTAVYLFLETTAASLARVEMLLRWNFFRERLMTLRTRTCLTPCCRRLSASSTSTRFDTAMLHKPGTTLLVQYRRVPWDTGVDVTKIIFYRNWWLCCYLVNLAIYKMIVCAAVSTYVPTNGGLYCILGAARLKWRMHVILAAFNLDLVCYTADKQAIILLLSVAVTVTFSSR